MTDRERLIGLLEEIDKHPDITCPSPKNVGACRICKHKINDVLCDAISREADYLLEHGIIVLPCKVGDIVYIPHKDSQTIEEKRVKSISHVINEFENSMEFNCKHNYAFLYTDINREVFLTREEAEKALKERDGS